MEDRYDGLALGWLKQWSGGNIHISSANNRGSNNRYYYTTNEGSARRYQWTSKYSSLAAFTATSGEEGGTYMSSLTVLQQAGIPTNPERH